MSVYHDPLCWALELRFRCRDALDREDYAAMARLDDMSNAAYRRLEPHDAVLYIATIRSTVQTMMADLQGLLDKP